MQQIIPVSSHQVKFEPSEVRAQLELILQSAVLRRSLRLRRFLTFIVERTINGQSHQLKEYELGIEVFDRNNKSFDPRLDPIVRVEAARLRSKLSEYYQTEGSQDLLLVELPRGGYIPRFAPVAREAFRQSKSESPAAANTIAVLPFADHSPSQDQEYFCDGITEELVSSLTKVKGLEVAAWTSTSWLKGRDWTPRQLGEQLKVKTLVEGSVRKEKDRLRITVQLIDVAQGLYLWSETYDREFKDVFAMQQEISEAIVKNLKVCLNTDEKTNLVKRYTENPIAYKLYLKGRFHWNKRSEDGLLQSISHFEKAIAEDSRYTLAHAGLADSYALLGNYGVLPSSQVRKKATGAAQKAVETDRTLAEARTSLGHVKATYEWDWENAEREFESAIQLNPDYATAHHWYAITLLMPMGRLDEAELEIRRAQKLDPVSASIARDVAVVYYNRREYETALEQCRRAIELDPNFSSAYWILGLVQEQLLMFKEAINAFEKGMGTDKPNPRLIGARGHCWAVCGRSKEARNAIAELRDLSRTRYVSPFDTALIYVGLGEQESAFKWLAKARQQRSYELVCLNVDPRLDPVRAGDRFSAFVKALRL